jgi:hypothetical protein
MASGQASGEIITDWRSFVAKFGFATAVAAGLMWFMATQIVLPMRDDQKAFMNSVISTNELNAKTHAAAASAMSQLTQVQQTQAATLTTLVDQQKQTTTILQQIRDDQRAGAWRDSKGGGTH